MQAVFDHEHFVERVEEMEKKIAKMKKKYEKRRKQLEETEDASRTEYIQKRMARYDRKLRKMSIRLTDIRADLLHSAVAGGFNCVTLAI